MTTAPPIPPPDLVSRIGGTPENYLDIGLAQRRIIESLLPDDWSLDGKAVLDFGCGTGRALTAFLPDADRAEFFGCDIHPESIAWAESELSPPLHFFICQETPPLAQPDQRFDLIYGVSVFSHITDQWSRWLVELHRVMRPGAIAVISVLGSAVAEEHLGIAWDDRIGMAAVDFHKGWEIGGPSALLAEWWVREHWGRAFEILRFEHIREYWHDFVVMRKRDLVVTAEALEQVDTADAREYAAVVANLEILQRQARELGERLRAQERPQPAPEPDCTRPDDASAEIQRLADQVALQQAEIDRLQSLLNVITSSNSWRLTAPLRRARTIAGNRR